jgi:hypothetical protein
MSEQQLQTLGFGSGIVWAFPTGGQTGANVTPIDIGTIQNVKLDVTADIKTLFGLYQYAVDSAIGKRNIKGTAAFAQFEFTAWNSLLFGSSGSTSSGAAQVTSYREGATVATGTYQVSVNHAGTFVQDGGVRYASGSNAGQPLFAITSGMPVQGQYSVSEGVYQFAAADVGAAVVITYSYSNLSGDSTVTQASAVPASPGPYTVTVANSGAFVSNGGVKYAATGDSMVKVSPGPPTLGEYTVADGVYTFAAADTLNEILITYNYSGTGGGIQTFTVTNQAMGTGPVVGLQLLLPYEAPSFAMLNRGIFLPNVRFGTLSLATKLDDYTEENTSFEAFANPVTGIVMQSYLPW